MPSEAPRAAAHASNLQLTTSRPLCERGACVAGHHACHMSATDCARPQSLPTANTCESVNGLYCCCVTAPLHSCLQSTPSSRPSPGVEGRAVVAASGECRIYDLGFNFHAFAYESTTLVHQPALPAASGAAQHPHGGAQVGGPVRPLSRRPACTAGVQAA